METEGAKVMKILFGAQNLRYCLDAYRGLLTREGDAAPIHLPRKSWEMLLYFVEHPGKLITEDEILDHVWGRDTSVGPSSVSQVIGIVRRALGDTAGEPFFVETVKGRGYRFLGVVERQGAQNAGGTSVTSNPINPSHGPHTSDPRPFDERSASTITVHMGKLPFVNPTLIGRDEILQSLDSAWSDHAIRLVSVVAFGGVGKTALAINWWHRCSLPGARRILGWSFYSQGAAEDRQASADTFLDHALRQWFHVPDPPKDSWERGELLAGLIRQEPSLLILDGLEPIQFPPGPQYGRFKDQGMISLLKELAAYNPGLCICTSRFPLTDLSDYDHSGMLEIELDNLTPEFGAEYLSRLGVKGGQSDRRQASIDFGNHALALTLLGSLLRRYGGDVRKRDIIPSLFDAKQGGHALRVMRAYENVFKDKYELDILRILGLFDRPADPAALRLLRRRSADDWALALENLSEARLIEYTDPDGPIDCHPLVREYFSDEFRKSDPEAFREFHSQLYKHYSKEAPQQPETLEAMTPLFYAVYHGCQGGHHAEVRRDVYRDRITRDEDYYLTQKLGAYGTNLSLLANFFDRAWNTPSSNLDVSDQSLLTSYVAFALGALGRLAEAIEPMRASAEAYISAEAWKNAAICLGNLSDLHLTLGDISEAISTARRSIDLADLSGNAEWRARERPRLATALHQAGLFDEAASIFDEAEKLEADRLPHIPFLAFRGGFQYCELLLDQGKQEEVIKRTRQTMPFSKRLLDSALDHLSLARAHSRGSTEAADEIDQSVTGLRRAGQLDELPRGLLTRAANSRAAGRFFEAQHDLEEVRILAARCGMRLFLADYHLEQARLFHAQERHIDGGAHYESAKRLVEELGYHRRDPEIIELSLNYRVDTGQANL